MKQNKPIKVIHIGKYYKPFRGGMETHIEDLVKHVPVNHEIIVSNTKNKTVVENVDGVKVTRAARLFNMFSTAVNPTLKSILKKSKADIYHMHLPNPMAVIAFLSARPKGKLVITWQSDIIKQKLPLRFFLPYQRKILKLADAIIVASKNYLNSSKYLKDFKNKCHVIPLGYDFDEKKLKKRKQACISQANSIKKRYPGKIVLFVGRLVSYKGVEYLIKAAKLASKNLGLHVLIIGEGPLKNKLKAISAKNIHFLGEVHDVMPYYYACDVFVLPSIERTEAFGIVQLEAISCKKPVISTKLNTGVEFINKKGILVKPKSVSQLAQAIVRATGTSTSNDTSRIAEESHSYCKRILDWKKVSKNILSLYKNLYKA